MAGLFFDGADLINAGLYALEGNWVQAGVSISCALPFIGTAVAGVTKAAKVVGAVFMGELQHCLPEGV